MTPPQYNPLKFGLATLAGAMVGLLVYRRIVRIEALGQSARFVAAVSIGVVTAAVCTLAYLVVHATDGFPGADEHPVGVATFFGICFGICAVLFRDGLKLTLQRKDPRA